MATIIETSNGDNGHVVVQERVENGYGYYEGGDGIEIGPFLRGILAAILRNFWIVVGIIGLTLAVALAVTLVQTPRYTAETSLEINDQSEQVLGEDFETQVGSADSWDTDRFLNTQLQILTSRSISERVANRLSLFEDEAFFAAMQAPAPDTYASVANRRDAVLAMLMENLEVDLPADSRVATVSFTTIEPDISAEIANAYAEEFIQASLQRRFDSSAYARDFVAEQLDEARQQLETSERELNSYAREAGLIRTSDTGDESGPQLGSITTESLSQINAAANVAQAERIAAEARYRAETAQPLLASPAALGNPVFQRLRSRYDDLRYELENAQERYGPEHPTVMRLTSEVATVEEQLAQLAREARASIRADYQAARDAETRLTEQVSRLQGDSLAEQDRSVRYNTLSREADTNRQIYEGLLQRYRELNASAGITASNVAIVDRATAPLLPSFPNPLLNAALGLVTGLLLAGGFVFLRSQLDDRIVTPEDLDQKTGLPLLGVVPRTGEDVVAELDDPKTVISEAYNAVRGSLMFATRNGLPRVLMVTSVQASEGKSTSAYAIAAGLARVGKRVLLVDADLRRPSIHALADLANEKGLSTLLVGTSTIAESVQPTADANLAIIPSGGRPPNPAELLSTGRLADLVAQLQQEFECIVIDSPPILAIADAPMLAAVADGVALVVEAERSRAGQIKTAIKRMRQVNAHLVGSILTKFDPQKPGNEQSSYYGYEYYQYRGK